MRREAINNLLLGGTIGVIALAIHALTDAAAPHYQLLALTLASAALFVVHLALALRRGRQSGPKHEKRTGREAALARFDRRNPFFRELTSDWTGLDEHPAADEAPVAAAETRAAEQSDG